MRRLDVQLVEVLDTGKGKYTVGESVYNKASFDEKRGIKVHRWRDVTPTNEQGSHRR